MSPMNTQKNTTLRYIIYFLLALTLFTPLIVANSMFFPFITGKAFFFRIVVELAFVLWVVLAFRDKTARPKISPVFIAVTLFTVMALIADLTGMNPIRSLWSNNERMEGWITIIHLWAYFVVMISVLRDRVKWHIFFNVSFIAATVVALYGVVQFFHGAAIHQSADRLDASLGNSEYLAVYMLIHFFLALYMGVVAWMKKQNWGWVYLGLAVLYGLIIFGTQTRGTMLAIVGGCFLMVFIFAVSRDPIAAKNPQTQRQSNVLRMIAGIILAVILLGVGGFYLIRNTHFIQSHEALQRLASISLDNPRLQYIWPMAWQGFKEHPILGWGQENFNYVFNEHYNPAMWAQEQWFDRAHNVFIDWAIAGGIFGFGFYVGLFVIAVWSVWKTRFDVRERAIWTALLAAYAVHNIFVFDNLASYILFFVVIAFLHTTSTETPMVPEKVAGKLTVWSEKIANYSVNPEITNWIVAPIVAVLFVIVIYCFNIRPIQANYLLIDALQNCQGVGQQGAPAPDVSYFTKALNINTYVANQEIREQVYTCAQDVLSAAGVSNDIKLSFYQLANSVAIAQANATPNDVRGFLFAGTFFDGIGQFTAATPYDERAYQLSPVKQSVLIELASNDFSLGSTTPALALLKKAYDEAPDDTTSQGAYARGLYLSNDYKDAIAILKQVLVGNPSDVQSHISLAASYLGVKDPIDAIVELNTVATLNPDASSSVATFIKSIKAGKNPFTSANGGQGQ